MGHDVTNRKLLWKVRSLRAHFVRHVLRRKVKVVAITGSCGKTSATSFIGKIIGDAAACFLGVDANAETGVIRSLLKMPLDCDFLVQEVGIAFQNQMKKRAALLRPDISVVTTIGQDHYTSFRSLDVTAREKGFLVEALPENGAAVLNADDPHVLAMAKRTKAKVFTYGTGEAVDVRATQIKADWPDRLSLMIHYQGESARLQTGLFGSLQVTSILAAITAALAAGVDLKQCVQSLNGIEGYPRRMSLHQASNGIWFVDDSFKAPFWGIPNVIEQLRDASAPRKTIVFGSFSDTPGSDSGKYRAMARRALAFCDRVIFVGKKSEYIHKMISPDNEMRLFAFDEQRDACRMIFNTALRDELILIKSSELDHLERLIAGQDRPS